MCFSKQNAVEHLIVGITVAAGSLLLIQNLKRLIFLQMPNPTLQY